MRNNENIAIVVLVLTAVILTAVIVGVVKNPQPANADSAMKDGDYTVATGAYTKDLDLLYVIDVAAKQLNAYVVNINTKALDLKDKVNLDRSFR